MSKLLVEREGATAILILNDPDRRNVLSGELCRELSAAIAAANAHENVKAIVLTGNGKAFCAGADLADLKAASNGDTRALEVVYSAFVDVLKSPLPTIAAVNGPAVGAGFNLALACDMRITAVSASLESRFLRIGLHPGGGHGWMLLRSVGWQTAARMLLANQVLDGREAERVGLSIACVADADLRAQSLKIANQTAVASRELLVRTKASLAVSSTASHEAAFRHETAEQLWSLAQEAFGNAIGGARDSRT